MSEPIIEFRSPSNLSEVVAENWRWLTHGPRIVRALKLYFDPYTQFHKPITAIQYFDGQLNAYRDRNGRWFDVSD